MLENPGLLGPNKIEEHHSNETNTNLLAVGGTHLTLPALGHSAASAGAASAPHAQRSPQPPAVRVVDLKAYDGTALEAWCFAAVKPGGMAWPGNWRRLEPTRLHSICADMV
jgi:hypothetical protein